MTRRERVISALCHKETDIIPFHTDFTMQEHKRIATDLGDENFDKKYAFHLHPQQYCGWPEEIPGKKEFFRDAYGVVWNRTGVDKDIGVISEPLIPDIEESTYHIPPLDEKRARAEIEAHIASSEDKFRIVGVGFSMFERAWSLLGMENTLAAMVASPTELFALMEEICEFNLRYIDIASEYDVDAIYFGDDWGQQRGLIFGKKHWDTFVKPNIKRMYERAKSKEKFVIQHSCGDCSSLLPDLIDLGLDCYQTFQPEIYDIEKVKREYGSDLSFWGGISTQRLLPYASPKEIYSEPKRVMDIMGKGGGYIAAPTHAMPGDIPTENFLAMVKAFEEQ